jgi:hypothetical protein
MLSTFLRRAFSAAVCAFLPTFVQAAASTPVLYRLDAASSYEKGCLPPCLCPIQINDDLTGTFVLVFDHSDPAWFDHYKVQDVNWALGGSPLDQRVTGSGEYLVGGQFAVQQRLQLDLSVDGAASVHFDSGLVAGGGSFPTIQIDVARNGFYCFDEVYSIVAKPVPASEVVSYGLSHTVYDEGCFAPCDCALQEWPVAGTFGLVDLEPGSSSTTRHRFAVVDVQWATISAVDPPDRAWKGFGIYLLRFDTVQHRLTLDLTDQAGTARRFESGLVTDTVAFPRIQIGIAVNGFYCFDRAFQLNAKPL